MVMTKSPLMWSALVQTQQCIVILPAGDKHSALALASEFNVLDHSTQVLESAAGDYFTAAEGYGAPDTPPILSFARGLTVRLSLPWFLWSRSNTELFVAEPPQTAALTDTGFTVGEKLVVVVKIYVKAPKNTVWGHSHGYDIGDHICDKHA